jgi:hypothetical protein
MESGGQARSVRIFGGRPSAQRGTIRIRGRNAHPSRVNATTVHAIRTVRRDVRPAIGLRRGPLSGVDGSTVSRRR